MTPTAQIRPLGPTSTGMVNLHPPFGRWVNLCAGGLWELPPRHQDQWFTRDHKSCSHTPRTLLEPCKQEARRA